MSGFTNRPRILKGAFVEYGLTIPPLFVLFQFNPVQLQRNRSLTFRAPELNDFRRGTGQGGAEGKDRWVQEAQDMREWHGRHTLSEVRDYQIVSVQEETLDFELRLDATDARDAGKIIAERSGVAPALSTLELMTYPKSEGVLTKALGALLGVSESLSFTRSENPPLVLFIWGVQRVLPVNINSLAITETEFDTLLNPVRASVAVNLTVIEGKNFPFKFSKTAKEAMSLLNVVNVADIVIPG